MLFKDKCHPYLLSSIFKPLIWRQCLDVSMVIDEASLSLMVNFPCRCNTSLLQIVSACLYTARLGRIALYLHDWRISVHFIIVSALLSCTPWSFPMKGYPISRPCLQLCNTHSRLTSFYCTLLQLAKMTILTPTPCSCNVQCHASRFPSCSVCGTLLNDSAWWWEFWLQTGYDSSADFLKNTCYKKERKSCCSAPPTRHVLPLSFKPALARINLLTRFNSLIQSKIVFLVLFCCCCCCWMCEFIWLEKTSSEVTVMWVINSHAWNQGLRRFTPDSL